jgi:hypothetical protein
MAHKRLAGTFAAALVVPLAAVILPATVAAAAPAKPAQPSDIREGTRSPNKLDGKALPTRATAAKRASASAAAAAATTPPVGTVRQWLGSDLPGYYRKDYTLRGVGQHIEVWVANDLAFPAGDCRNVIPNTTTVTDAQVAELIDQFDNNMYPKETAAFSTPPDRDGTNSAIPPDSHGNGGVYTGDGNKTVTLVDNVRDENFYDFPANPTYTAGFFSQTLSEAFDRNTMTIDAFDWTHRTTANPPDEPTADPCTSRPARPWTYEGVFAHEWQHLLLSYVDPLETTWLNEGLSDFAIALTGYSNTTATVFDPGPDNHINCFQGFGTVQTQYNPNPRDCGGAQNSLNLWGEGANGSGVLADYGHAFSLMLFLFDRYGLGFMTKLHRDAALQGIASLDALLETVGVHDVYQVLHDFQTMTLVDKLVGDSRRGIMLGVPKGRVTTKSLRSSVNLDNTQSYSVPGAAPNGADYVVLQKNGQPIRDLRSLSFSGVKTLPTLPLAWTIVNNDPDRNNNPVLFSGNASNTDAAMVAHVSVPTTDPTLRFLAKYGAEEGYDYGYVSVSTDGGSTYTPIAGDKTVAGPLGPGLNGSTTGFEAHSYDLSAYAGQNVLVSFRYVSDGGVNEGGLLIDDITVGGTSISDGSSLDPFDSPTEIKPLTVNNWNLRLVGLDEHNKIALQFEFNGKNNVNLGLLSIQLLTLRLFPKVVAVVAYDEPTEQVNQYAPYTLTVNGVVQPGGGPAA